MKDELNERQWQRLLPLLPPQKPSRGRPNTDHRTVVNAILWIGRTGAGWRDLPADAGVGWKTSDCYKPLLPLDRLWSVAGRSSTSYSETPTKRAT